LPDGKSPALPPSGEAKPEGALAKPVAVVIATDNYKDSGIPGAPQAIDNAAHIVRVLKDDLGLDGTRIVTGRNATLSDFEDIFGKPGDTKSELRDVLSKMKTPEVIVYYAGRAKALNGGKDVLLLPADAEPDKPETGVSLSALYNQLAAMGIPKLRVYLDSPFVPGDTVANVQTAPRVGPFGVLTPRDWVALSAARDDGAVPDEVDRPRSLFTESLVAGLRGIADTTGEGDGDGTVSAQELYDFMRGQAEAATKRGDKVPMPSFYGPPGEALRAY